MRRLLLLLVAGCAGQKPTPPLPPAERPIPAPAGCQPRKHGTVPTDEATRASALEAYRSAMNALHSGDPGDLVVALSELDTSYAAWPHPDTLVRIGLAFDASGDEAAARCAYAQALALAEEHGPLAPRVRGGHRGPVLALAAHDGAGLVVSGGADGAVKLWSAGVERRQLVGHDGPVRAVAVGPSGQVVASGDDSTIRLWDVASGRELARRDAGGRVLGLAWSPDGKRLAAAGDAPAVWTGADKSPLAGRVTAVAWSPDGAALATLGSDGALTLWKADGTSARLPGVAPDPLAPALPVAAGSLSFRPDGALVAGTLAGTALAWDLGAGAVRVLGPASGVAFSPDGTLALLRPQDVRLLGPADLSSGGKGQLVAHAPGGPIAWAGPRLLVGGGDGRVRAAGVAAAPAPLALDGSRAALAVSGGIALVDRDGVRLLPRTEGEPAAALAFAPDGRLLVAAGTTLTARDLDTGASIAFAGGHQEPIRWVGIDGARILSGDDRQQFVWSGDGELLDVRERAYFATQKRKVVLAYQSPARADAAAGDGEVSASADELRLWRFGPSPWTRRLGEDGAGVVALSPGGRLATGPAVELWDAASRRPAPRRIPIDDAVALAWDGDGARLAAVDRAGRLVVWDGSNVSVVAEAVSGSALAWDGDLLAAGDGDGSLQLRRGGRALTLVVERDGEWLAVAPDGSVDGSSAEAGGPPSLVWQAGDVELPGFVAWDQRRRAGLVGELFDAR